MKDLNNQLSKLELAGDSFQTGLRPSTLSEFIGQKEIKKVLNIMIKSAKNQNKLLDHLVFFGYPGLGKTTLAYILSNELNVKFYQVVGSAVSRPGDLASILLNFDEPFLLFIDEIHRLSMPVEEILYPAMEDGQLHLVSGSGSSSETITLNIAPFTLIGATTKMGNLSAPLRDRFGAQLRLRPYTLEELSQIVKNSAKMLSVEIDDKAALEIAARSRNTPRIANRLLKRSLDYMHSVGASFISRDHVIEMSKLLEVSSDGLTSFDLQYLKCLYQQNSPVGLKTLASLLEEDCATISEVYEPYLLSSGLIKKVSRGRILTDKGKALCEEV